MNMGNLGLYEVMVTVAKRVGGPAKLGGLIFGAGTIFGIGVTQISKTINREEGISQRKRYKVVSDYTNTEGLSLKKGDSFIVKSVKEGIVTIEKVEEGAFYRISVEDLKRISDYDVQ